MHLRLLVCSVLPVTLLLAVEPAAAQELQQCSIEGQPCGTPQQLDERIQRCLQDPNLCRNVRVIRGGDNPADASAHAAPGPASPVPASVALPTKRVVLERAVSRKQAAGAPAAQQAAPEPPAAAQAGGPADAVAKAAGELPLDPAVKALNDTMPGNAAAVERRLGLRRTHVPGVDMRQRTPTPAEIVDALEPAKDPHR
jgi:hypothetical protein